MQKLLILLFCFFSFITLTFAQVDTVTIHSNAMQRDIKAVVIKPSNYKKVKNFPTVYLLHGANGNYQNWVKKVPEIIEYANTYQTIIVCPSGANNSWYFDSPIDSTYKFETFVSTEVPNYIDTHYKTKKDRKYRAITGLSMGGHGAMFISFRHAETFGACGSMSGALVVDVIKKAYDIEKRLGNFDPITNDYKQWSVLNIIEKYPKDSLAIIIDCGMQDFIYKMSDSVHNKMVSLKIPHDYIVRPGKHDWVYWKKAIEYQLVYFKDFFNREKEQIITKN
ncbi:MAG: esterase family protein [Ferruginibacter sp.]|nr:esterase family protein [Ferruginibacter sp.]